MPCYPKDKEILPFLFLELLLMSAWIVVVYLLAKFMEKGEFAIPLISIFFCFFQGCLLRSMLRHSTRSILSRPGLRCEFCGSVTTGDDNVQWLTAQSSCGHAFHEECYNNAIQMTTQIMNLPCPVCVEPRQVSLESLVVELRPNEITTRDLHLSDQQLL